MRPAKQIVAICLSVGVSGCSGVTQLLQGEAGQKVTVQASDPTPPSKVILETQGRAGGDVTLNLGAPPSTINIGRGESFILRAVAEDSEGIKEVATWGTMEKTCEDPITSAAQHTGPGASAPLARDVSSATAGGTASSVRYVSYTVQVDVSCPATTQFVEQKFVFWGEAKNFSNMGTKGPSMTVIAR